MMSQNLFGKKDEALNSIKAERERISKEIVMATTLMAKQANRIRGLEDRRSALDEAMTLFSEGGSNE